MTVSKNGVSHHVHAPCPRCGYGTRSKQYPINCACIPPNRPRFSMENGWTFPDFGGDTMTASRCYHCGRPIMLFEFKGGGQWWHADPTASRWTSKNCLGRITEATPEKRTTP